MCYGFLYRRLLNFDILILRRGSSLCCRFCFFLRGWLLQWNGHFLWRLSYRLLCNGFGSSLLLLLRLWLRSFFGLWCCICWSVNLLLLESLFFLIPYQLVGLLSLQSRVALILLVRTLLGLPVSHSYLI